MGSLHKRSSGKSPYWMASWWGPDGRQISRSTKCTNRNDALQVLAKWEGLTNRAKVKALTEHQVRNVAADLFFRATGDAVERQTVREYLESWKKRKELELADTSVLEYQHTAKEFLEHLGSRADRDINLVTHAQASEWRDAMAGRVSATTVNKKVKIMRSAWNQAIREGIVTVNPFAALGHLKVRKSKQTQRRAFTMDELRRILAAASGEWRGIILFGLYTGQRLGDILSIRWSQIDTVEGVVRFITAKTDTVLEIPLAKPLLEWIGTAKVPKSGDAPLFPKAARIPPAQNSKVFIGILADAGLRVAEPASHEARKQGRSGRRTVYDTSFHALRHTATSLLKNAGVSDVVAREIIGHATEAVSRTYTHIEQSTMRKAIEALPDVTKAGKKAKKGSAK